MIDAAEAAAAAEPLRVYVERLQRKMPQEMRHAAATQMMPRARERRECPRDAPSP